MAEKAKVEKVEKTVTGLDITGEIILVYLVSILGFIFSFVAEKDVSRRAKFAYNQSGAIFICLLVLGSLSVIPFIGLLFATVSFVIFIFAVITIIKGCQGEDFKIPGIYELGELIWGNKRAE